MPQITVHFVVPDGWNRDEHVSGGNVYDRRLAAALRARGVDVRMVAVPAGRRNDLAEALRTLPRDALVLVDELIAVGVPTGLEAHSDRLRILVLAHMVASALPGADSPVEAAARERVALRSAREVIATSEWTRSELIARGLASPGQVTVARPGTDPALPAVGSTSGGRFLCVGAVAPHKGQDVLVAALSGLTDVAGWSCAVVGSLRADVDFARATDASIRAAALAERVVLTGVRTGGSLESAYRGADLVIAPSRAESYGMAVAEALARGIPVVASDVGGLPEAVAGGGGILIPPDDPDALRDVLRRWLSDPRLRTALRAEAVRSRGATRSWDDAARVVAAVLERTGAVRELAGADRRGAS